MASIFKGHYTKPGPNGKRIKCKTKKWFIDYVDADGVTRRVTGYVNKDSTLAKAADLELRPLLDLDKKLEGGK